MGALNWQQLRSAPALPGLQRAIRAGRASLRPRQETHTLSLSLRAAIIGSNHPHHCKRSKIACILRYGLRTHQVPGASVRNFPSFPAVAQALALLRLTASGAPGLVVPFVPSPTTLSHCPPSWHTPFFPFFFFYYLLCAFFPSLLLSPLHLSPAGTCPALSCLDLPCLDYLPSLATSAASLLRSGKLIQTPTSTRDGIVILNHTLLPHVSLPDAIDAVRTVCGQLVLGAAE